MVDDFRKSRNSCEWRLMLPFIHCNLREKPGQILADFFKPEMEISGRGVLNGGKIRSDTGGGRGYNREIVWAEMPSQIGAATIPPFLRPIEWLFDPPLPSPPLPFHSISTRLLGRVSRQVCAGACFVRTSCGDERGSLSVYGCCRRGRASVYLLAIIAMGVACAGFALWFSARDRANFDDVEIVTTTVWRGPYDHALVTKGVMESASSTELKCDVRSRGGTTPILEVLPEGAVVKEGDVVMELDPSILREQESEQKIAISTRESLLTTAENTHKAAVIARKEYLEGLYIALENQYESELYIAERGKATAVAAVESAKVLFEKAIGSALDVQVSYAALDDATNKLECARTNLETLRNLTKEKELTLLDAAISSAEADLKAQRRSLQLEQRRLKDIQKWIRNCTIRATAPGQVVYNNDPDFFRSSSYTPFVVEPGAGVRERQTVVWLPNPDDMQVRATVSEARVTLVQVGMPVSIRVEALDDELIEGEVVKINPFAEPNYNSSMAINKYGVTIKIKNPPSQLRVGMNAEAWIHLEQLPSALQLPVQALAESNGRYFSLVRGEDDSYETREVELQSTNDEVAAIAHGLSEGDEVVINPRSAGDLLQLPGEDEATPLVVEEREQEAREARPVIRQTGGE